MTPQRLRTKLRKIREQAEEMAEEGGELNLIPYLDIVTNVIMFMLATTTFAAALGDINVSSPTTASTAQLQNHAAARAEERAQPDGLGLGQGLHHRRLGRRALPGLQPSTPRATSAQPPGATLPTIPKKGNDFDYDGLAKTMTQIKASPTAKNETKVIVNANPNIVYDVIVQVLDACRGKTDRRCPIPTARARRWRASSASATCSSRRA